MSTPDAAVKGPQTVAGPEAMDVFKGFGFEIAVPRWATRGIAVLLIVGVAATVYARVLPLIVRPTSTEALLDGLLATSAVDSEFLIDPQVQRVIYDRSMKKRLDGVHHLVENMIQLAESSKHFNDPDSSEMRVLDDVRGKVQVRYYNADGCVLVLRKPAGASAATQHWIPQEVARREPSPGDILSASRTGALQRLFDLPTVHAADGPPGAAPVQACGGRCQSPHPGSFSTWNGPPNGCWLPVWRRWPEGCTHYQWFNTCAGYWDTNPDGSPRVFWTCCVH